MPLFAERELLSNVKCSAIPSVVYEPSSSLLLSSLLRVVESDDWTSSGEKKNSTKTPSATNPSISRREGTKERRNEGRKGIIVHYILRERNGVKMSAGSGKMIGQSVSERDHAAPALLLLSCAISFLRFSKRKKFDGKLRMRAKRCTRSL